MNITLLDGGMGQELVARAGKATALWSVQALLDQPELVRAVHDDFFRAGAMVATTNTYSVLPDRLVAHDLGDHLERLQRLGCKQAVDARDAHGSGMVLGSLGPQGFSYQPELSPPADQAAETYAMICKIQMDYVDAFMAETMASVDQVRGAAMGMSGLGKPIWMSITVDDDDGTKLRSGEPVIDILPLLKEYDVAAINVNCSIPEAVNTAIPLLTSAGIPVGAYANGFTKIHSDFNKIGATVDMLKARNDLSPAVYADFAQGWIDAGATVIGGCCEVGPSHIAELKQRFAI
jgi:S-methylmethionine-dependent homocysteine/selenocysteine methylase